VLEVGSGTGQHAVHFAAAMPWLVWQCSDRPGYLPGIALWLDEAGLANTPAPVALEVNGDRPESGFTGLATSCSRLPAAADGSRAPTPALPREHGRELEQQQEQTQDLLERYERSDQRQRQTLRFDAAYSANTLHIMSWREVEAFFAGLDTALATDATLVVYGPFNYAGAFTSDSNAAFDASLKARDPAMGIRDFEAVDALARAIGLQLVTDAPMPANNRLLVWHRGARIGVAAIDRAPSR